jgi:predicted ATPase
VTTELDVVQARQRIDSVWENPPARNGRFGNALRSVTVSNIRGLDATVEFGWPVTAIGGPNGCGKTTLLQVCSAAFTKHGSGRRNYTLGRWIGPALLGESPPITPPARIAYSFADDTPSLDVPYQVERKRWGYPRRENPERHVEFVGIADFSPRIERQDRTHQNRARLHIHSTTNSDPRIVESISRILGSNYDASAHHRVSIQNAKWVDEIPQLTRDGYRYTESHMGAGEQKVVRLVHQLERIPERSLVLLEEPELTLHPDAQYGLAWYLMALASRRGHQVIFATHSFHMFEALPKAARVLLTRDKAGVAVLHGVHHLSAARALSSSVRSNLDLVLVEDEVAEHFLKEIFRKFSAPLLAATRIVPIGNFVDVQRMSDRFRHQGVRCIGVRDPDQAGNPAKGLFSLPGGQSPETLLLDPQNIARAEHFIHELGKAYDRAQAYGLGYSGAERAKRVFRALCSELYLQQEVVTDRLTLAWLAAEESQLACQDLVKGIQTIFESES